METIVYNQFQGIYELDDYRKVLVDYLYNEIKTYNEKTKFYFKYNEQYELRSIRLNNIIAQKSNNILNITLITSLECNMHCLYCYEKKDGLSINNKERSTDANIILKFITNEIKNNCYKSIDINILGGEPLLENNISYLDKFFDGIKLLDINSHVSFVTNGINLSKYIENIISWKVNEIQVTLDGTENIHNLRRKALDNSINGFKIIQNGINLLIANGIEVYIRVNVDKNNVNNIMDLSNFIIKENWINKGVCVYLYPITFSDNKNYMLDDTELNILKMVLYNLRNENEQIRKSFKYDFHGIDYIDSILNEKIPQIRTRFCGVSKGQYVFSFDGTILNCWWGLTDDVFKIGRIENSNLYIDYTKVEKFNKRNTLEIERCNKCKFKYICGGGCTYKEYINKGTTDRGYCAEFDSIIKEYLNYVL